MTCTLYFVIPCYNEEAVLNETSRRLKDKIESLISRKLISEKSKICFVNDGSTDKTWEIIENLHNTDPVFSGVNLSTNRGHQNALLCGLLTVKDKCDFTISMDADLQDDVDACDEMISKFISGYDVVYGVRKSRSSDTWFKRNTAQAFYKIMSLMGAKTIYNHADFRLMSKRVLDGLSQFNEVNLFLRGIVPLVGFDSSIVYYNRSERFAGESKYPLKKMLGFALDGITSLSIKPIRMITLLGFTIFTVSILIFIYALTKYFLGANIVGWTFLAISIWAIGGLVLLSLGVIGEYVGKIYLETKARPRFIVKDFLDKNL